MIDNNPDANIIGLKCSKKTIEKDDNAYLLRPHISNGFFVKNRAKRFMKEYFGTAINLNKECCMENRKMGFEDGYLACLDDLGIKLTYIKEKENKNE